MKSYELDQYISWFEGYVSRFIQNQTLDRECIVLKKDHSLRVLKEAKALLAHLNISSKMERLICLAALFHDIGRFPQYYYYKTFNDTQSQDHGLLGFKTLRQENILDSLTNYERKLVLQSVLRHNRAQIPQWMEGDLRFILQIIRDADKLDIFLVLLSYFGEEKINNQVVMLGLKDDPECYTSTVLQQIRGKKMVNYQDMTRINDFKLLLCSWVYDLNYAHSCQEVLKRGYLEKIFSSLPETRQMEDLQDQLLTDLRAACRKAVFAQV